MRLQPDHVFSVFGLGAIGIFSGLAVSLVKLLQANVYGGNFAGVEFKAALVTYGIYIVLGAIGAVFLVDHDAKGQKMLKSAFLMGFITPSFLLALLSQPISKDGRVPNPLRQIPQIVGNLLVRSAVAQTSQPGDASTKNPYSDKVFKLEKSTVAPKFSESVWHALGVNVESDRFTYVVGKSADREKAIAAAARINSFKSIRSVTYPLTAKVVQPEGIQQYYVTLGELGSPQQVSVIEKYAKDAALQELQASNDKAAKNDAALILRGQVIDASAMFQKVPTGWSSPAQGRP